MVTSGMVYPHIYCTYTLPRTNVCHEPLSGITRLEGVSFRPSKLKYFHLRLHLRYHHCHTHRRSSSYSPSIFFLFPQFPYSLPLSTSHSSPSLFISFLFLSLSHIILHFQNLHSNTSIEYFIYKFLLSSIYYLYVIHIVEWRTFTCTSFRHNLSIPESSFPRFFFFIFYFLRLTDCRVVDV